MVRLLLLLSILLFSINISAMSTAIGHGPIGLMADISQVIEYGNEKKYFGWQKYFRY